MKGFVFIKIIRIKNKQSVFNSTKHFLWLENFTHCTKFFQAGEVLTRSSSYQ